MSESAATPRRRWLRFSLSGLVLVMIVVAIGLAWKARQLSAQRQAVAEFEKIGGTVYRFEPWGPSWLHEAFGKEDFADVERVDLMVQTQTTDETLALLSRFPRVRSVNVWSDQMTDEGMRHLADLPGLTELNIYGAPRVTKEGIVHLARLPELRTLMFVGDVPLESFRAFPSVTTLSVTVPVLSEEGMASLLELKDLQRLNVYGQEGDILDDIQAVAPARLPKLEWLHVTRGGYSLGWSKGQRTQNVFRTGQ